MRREGRHDPAAAVRRDVERAVGAFGLRGGYVVAGVSGGLDSTVLADVLASLARRLEFRLAVGHIHHGLRGAEADADEESVRARSERLGIPFERERIAPDALREGRSSRDRPTRQEAARSLRYAALERIAARLGATHIATAHHADDQAETVLLRLFRGSGPDGLVYPGGHSRAVPGRPDHPAAAAALAVRARSLRAGARARLA
jgi:tRNA(Ile)-lysidine synthase